MKCTRHNIIFLALALLLTVCLIVCAILVGLNTRYTYKSALLLLQTTQLSSELRQSSDDLTRFIRTYTVTGNESYWGYFLEVLAIRNGENPLPKEPYRNYWDLLISDGSPPRGHDPPKSLQKRMREALFTDQEFELLEEARRQSNDLIDLETVAYNAMKGKYRPANGSSMEFSVESSPNQTLAMALVHSIPYHIWKGRIMRPIDKFTEIATQRVQDALTSFSTVGVSVQIVLGITIFLFILLFMLYIFVDFEQTQIVKVLEKKARNVEHAPKEHVAIIFTDVQNSTGLWEQHPDAMRTAMTLHHNTIREVIQKHKAYEVKTIGDSFMITTDSADTAVQVVNDIQIGLLDQPWPVQILETIDACAQFQDKKLAFKGLRCRIGIDIGDPEVVYDEVSKGYDYYGDTPNIAARVEAVAHGGQTLITKKVYGELSPAVRDNYDWIDIGGIKLKGMTDKTHVYQVSPKDLVRHFPVPESSSAQQTVASTGSSVGPHGRAVEEMTMIDIVSELRRLRAVVASNKDGSKGNRVKDVEESDI